MKLIKRVVQWHGRLFFYMADRQRSRLWEVQTNEKKLSAQLSAVKSPECELIKNELKLG